MKKNKANNLKDFLLVYDNKKSDREISQMLSIPMEKIKHEKEKILADKMKENLKTI